MTQLMQPGGPIESPVQTSSELADPGLQESSSSDHVLYPKLKPSAVFKEVDQRAAHKVYEGYLDLSTRFCETYAPALDVEHLVSIHNWFFGSSTAQDFNRKVIAPNNMSLALMEDFSTAGFAYRRVSAIVYTLNQYFFEKIGEKFSLNLPPMDRGGDVPFLPLLSVSFSRQGSLEIVQALNAIEANLIPKVAEARQAELRNQQHAVEVRKKSKWWRMKQLALLLPDPEINMANVDMAVSLRAPYIARAKIQEVKQSGAFTTMKPTQDELNMMAQTVIDCLDVLMDA